MKHQTRFNTATAAVLSRLTPLCLLALLALQSAFAADPVLLGRWPSYTRGAAHAVVVTNNRAYVAAGSGGLMILDVSNPSRPLHLGSCNTPGDACGVALSGNLAFVADGQVWAGPTNYIRSLQIIDVSNPTNPVHVGHCDVPGFAAAVAASGHYAYVGDLMGALHIIDVSTPSHPVRVGEYAPTAHTGAAAAGSSDLVIDGRIMGIAVAENLAFIAHAGLSILDVSNPTNPVCVGNYAGGYAGQFFSVVVRSNLAFCADVLGFSVVDISDPAQPLRVGGYSLSDSGISWGYGYDVAVQGNLAFLASSFASCIIVDITDPTNPVPIGFDDEAVPTFGENKAVAVVGNMAFLVENGGSDDDDEPGGGIRILDVTEPTSMTTVGSFRTSGYTYNVTSVGTLAYVADGSGGLAIMDVRNPASPVLLGQSPTGVHGVTVTSNLAFITSLDEDNYEGYVHILDVQNSSNAVEVSAFPIQYAGPNGNRVVVSGNLAFVVDGQRWTGSNYVGSFQMLDVSNSLHPVHVGRCDTGFYVQAIAVVGNLAFVAAGSAGLQIINVSNPANPVRLSSFSSRNARSVAVSGNLAYLTDTGGLSILDVSNPASPLLLGSYPAGGSILAVTNHLAFLAGGCTLEILDVIDPANCVLLGRFETSDPILSVALSGNLALVADGASGLSILQVLPFLRLSPSTEVTALQIHGELGREYVMEYAAALSASNWTSLPTIILSNSPQTILDGTANKATQRFYRTRRLQ